MRILVLAPKYLDLYKEIVEELIRQGHTCHYIEDIDYIKYDYTLRPKTTKSKIKNIAKYLLAKISGCEKKYWKRLIASDPKLNERYDIFLCINGSSFHPHLLSHLKKQNPSLKSILYLWDSDSYRNFFRIAKYFSKVYSFDLNDCRKYKGTEFLPFFWSKTQEMSNEENLDLSLVGTNHDGRLEFINKVSKMLDGTDIKYYLKVIIPDWETKKNNSFSKTDIASCDHLVLTKPISVDEMNALISKSRCILDTSRNGQCGTTPRLIWALSQGKKIITTNNSIREFPFYDKQQIDIIDFDNPKIDITFIKSEKKFVVSDYINQLRIDNWINILLKHQNVKNYHT